MFYVYIGTYNVQIVYTWLSYKAFYCNFSKSYSDVPGCSIHIDIFFTVPVLVTTVFLKMKPVKIKIKLRKSNKGAFCWSVLCGF